MISYYKIFNKKTKEVLGLTKGNELNAMESCTALSKIHKNNIQFNYMKISRKDYNYIANLGLQDLVLFSKK